MKRKIYSWDIDEEMCNTPRCYLPHNMKSTLLYYKMCEGGPNDAPRTMDWRALGWRILYIILLLLPHVCLTMTIDEPLRVVGVTLATQMAFIGLGVSREDQLAIFSNGFLDIPSASWVYVGVRMGIPWPLTLLPPLIQTGIALLVSVLYEMVDGTQATLAWYPPTRYLLPVAYHLVPRMCTWYMLWVCILAHAVPALYKAIQASRRGRRVIVVTSPLLKQTELRLQVEFLA
jgi:hypothetical protein